MGIFRDSSEVDEEQPLRMMGFWGVESFICVNQGVTALWGFSVTVRRLMKNSPYESWDFGL